MSHLSADRQPQYSVHGFTLIELLVVLVILALVMSISAPVLYRANESARLERAAALVYDGLRRSRSTAVTQASEVALDVRSLVPDRAIEITDSSPGASSSSLIFYPDGSATFARFTLALGAYRRSLTVDWLTGRAAFGE